MSRKNQNLLAGCAFAAFALTFNASAAVKCDPDNGGITLPAGFCAVVAADGLGNARHVTVAPNGDVYVALQGRRGQGGGVVALRDTEGNGKLNMKETIGVGTNLTGVQLRNGYMYVASPTQVIRYKMTPGQLKPTGEAEIVVADLPEQRMHEDKGIAFDGKGGLYVNIGAPSNACQAQDRQSSRPGYLPAARTAWRHLEVR
jgi:glucose/arabinose dehydrogenase